MSNPGGEGLTWEAYLTLPLRTSAREKTENLVSTKIRELTKLVSAPSKNCVGFVLVHAGFKTERKRLPNARTRARENSGAASSSLLQFCDQGIASLTVCARVGYSGWTQTSLSSHRSPVATHLCETSRDTLRKTSQWADQKRGNVLPLPLRRGCRVLWPRDYLSGDATIPRTRDPALGGTQTNTTSGRGGGHVFYL